MKKLRLFLLAGLIAAVMLAGAGAPTATQTDAGDAVVPFGGMQQNSIPTILPPL